MINEEQRESDREDEMTDEELRAVIENSPTAHDAYHLGDGRPAPSEEAMRRLSRQRAKLRAR